MEVRLENRLQNHFQRGLHDPVPNRRDPQATDLAVRLRNRDLPDPARDERPSPKVRP
jgi:hypothetical protein